MKAIVLDHYGPPADLEFRDIPKPEPADDEVLVKVHATAVNDWDWCFVRGKPYLYRLFFGLRSPKVAVLGTEVAGVVEATGPGAKKFQAGDRVYGDLSEAGFGGFAEYVAAPESALAAMPDGMTFVEAAAVPHVSLSTLFRPPMFALFRPLPKGRSRGSRLGDSDCLPSTGPHRGERPVTVGEDSTDRPPYLELPWGSAS